MNICKIVTVNRNCYHLEIRYESYAIYVTIVTLTQASENAVGKRCLPKWTERPEL